MKKYYPILYGMVIAPAGLSAQARVPAESGVVAPASGPHFFFALVAGIILAVAFQLLLTTLTAAAGITSLGPIRERGTPGHTRSESPRGIIKTVRTFSTDFGIWALLTASIALFFSSWLAVEMSLTGSVLIGTALGLVIWGVFYVLMTLLETSAVSSLVGSVIGVAKAGLRSTYLAASSLISKSPEDKVVDTAEEIAYTVRKEVFGDLEMDDVRKAVKDYVGKLDPSRFRPENIRRELAELLDEAEVRAVVSHEGPLLDHETISAHLSTRSGMSAERAKAIASNVQGAISTLREEFAADKDKPSQVVDAAMRITGMSGEEARATRERVENYLRSTGKDELNPEGIKRDLQQLVTNPKASLESLRERLSSIDKSTVTAVLEQRQDMSHDEAARIVEQVDRTIHEIADHIPGQAQTREQATGVVSRVLSARNSAIRKIQDYLNSLGRDELRYEGVRDDMVLLFHDPKKGSDALVNRLKSMDRDTLKAILSSRRDISEEDAEDIISRIESARDDVIKRAEKMRDEVDHRIEEVRREAIRETDEMRKTAANAAWWAFAAAAASGVSAVLGGIVAVAT